MIEVIRDGKVLARCKDMKEAKKFAKKLRKEEERKRYKYLYDQDYRDYQDWLWKD